jgi:hypothetical protein
METKIRHFLIHFLIAVAANIIADYVYEELKARKS